MTAPGVGPIVASAFIAVIDDPHRFRRSSQAGAYIGFDAKALSIGRGRLFGQDLEMG
jgi:transposase